MPARSFAMIFSETSPSSVAEPTSYDSQADAVLSDPIDDLLPGLLSPAG